MTGKLEDRLRAAIRLKQYSLRTEETYVGWYRRYVLWHGKRHPAEDFMLAVSLASPPACWLHLRGWLGIKRAYAVE